jgi:hypothetical protein
MYFQTPPPPSDPDKPPWGGGRPRLRITALDFQNVNCNFYALIA